MLFIKTQQQDIGNSMEPRLYLGQALRMCTVRPALTGRRRASQLHLKVARVRGGGRWPFPHLRRSSGSGAYYQELPTNSADEAFFIWNFLDLFYKTHPLRERVYNKSILHLYKEILQLPCRSY